MGFLLFGLYRFKGAENIANKLRWEKGDANIRAHIRKNSIEYSWRGVRKKLQQAKVKDMSIEEIRVRLRSTLEGE